MQRAPIVIEKQDDNVPHGAQQILMQTAVQPMQERRSRERDRASVRRSD